MDNPQLRDIGGLTLIAQLKKSNLLHPDDRDLILEQMQTDWGKQIAMCIVKGQPINEDDRAILARYSTVFQSTPNLP